jgi:hypothetical protein
MLRVAQVEGNALVILREGRATGMSLPDYCVSRSYKASKQRADVREQNWERKMRERMKSICTGC